MTDLTERLRKWCHAPEAASAQDIMDEAAKEIEQLHVEAAFLRESIESFAALMKSLVDERTRLTAEARYWRAMHDQNSPDPQWMDRSRVSPSDPNRQCLLYTDKLGGFMWIGRKGLLPNDVSHWCYLPEPPNAGTSSPPGEATTTPSSAP
jgi:hypothetical protein